MKKLLTALTIAILSTTAIASVSDSSAQKLAEVSGYDSIFYSNLVTPLQAERMALIDGMVNDDSLTDEQRQQALDVYDAYAQALIQTLDTPQVQAELKKIYIQSAKNTFTQAEVDAQVAFYGSTDGQNALKKQEDVFAQYLTRANDAYRDTVKKYEDKHLKKMQDDIKKILKK